MKTWSIIPTFMLALYLFTVGVQPLHVYLEHFGEPHCHGECHGSCTTTDADTEGIAIVEETCPVCDFHFSFLQEIQNDPLPEPLSFNVSLTAVLKPLASCTTPQRPVQRGPPSTNI